jgi:hypothetical protein
MSTAMKRRTDASLPEKRRTLSCVSVGVAFSFCLLSCVVYSGVKNWDLLLRVVFAFWKVEE